jgi:hypothetical protein
LGDAMDIGLHSISVTDADGDLFHLEQTAGGQA